MKELWKILGVTYILLGFIAISYSISNGNPWQIFWICYVSMILIGIGFIIKSSKLLLTQLNILLIPYIVWNIDFFYQLISGKALWGITDYFFNGYTDLGQIISSQHIFTVPIIIVALYFLKIQGKNAWIISFVQVSFIFLMTRIFTSSEYNINCVFESCIPIQPTPYGIFWFLGYLAIILLTNFLILNIKYLKKIKKKPKQED